MNRAVVPWKPFKHQEIYDNLVDINLPHLCRVVLLIAIPPLQAQIWMAGALDDIGAVTSATGEPRLASMATESAAAIDTGVHYSSTISAYELWQIQKQRITLREEYLALWRGSVANTGTGRPIDALILPVAPFAAPPHGKTMYVFDPLRHLLMMYIERLPESRHTLWPGVC